MNSRAIIFILLPLIIAGCGIKKESINNNLSKPKTAKTLIKKIKENNKTPEWLSLKGKVSLNKDGQQIKFPIDICIRKDSAIWMSAKAPFGIELFRILLTPDSIYFMNIQKSTYTKEAISYLYQHIKIEIDYMQIQQIFFGTPTIPKAKYNFSENEKNYRLSSKNKNKKTITFLVEKQNFRIVEGNYYTEKNKYFSFEINDYYKVENDFLIPKNLQLDVKASDNFLSELNYTKIICNKKQKMHFFIPKSYVEIK